MYLRFDFDIYIRELLLPFKSSPHIYLHHNPHTMIQQQLFDLKHSGYPTDPFSILELQDQEIDKLCVVQQDCLVTDFGAPKLWKCRPGKHSNVSSVYFASTPSYHRIAIHAITVLFRNLRRNVFRLLFPLSPCIGGRRGGYSSTAAEAVNTPWRIHRQIDWHMCTQTDKTTDLGKLKRPKAKRRNPPFSCWCRIQLICDR